jgi:hypothetical protein
MNTDKDAVEEYTPPNIEVLGSLEELTQGGSAAGTLDAVYPVGTPSTRNLFS